MFLKKIKNIFCVPDTKFVSATIVASAGKRGNICVGNNVSATKCNRLPGPVACITGVYLAEREARDIESETRDTIIPRDARGRELNKRLSPVYF